MLSSTYLRTVRTGFTFLSWLVCGLATTLLCLATTARAFDLEEYFPVVAEEQCVHPVVYSDEVTIEMDWPAEDSDMAVVSDATETESFEPSLEAQTSVEQPTRGPTPKPTAKPKKKKKVEVTIVRQCCENDCITGTLSFGDFTCKTLELADRDNKKNVSCIPAGTYVCKRRESRRFGKTFEVTGVPGRGDILIHVGNTKKDTHGCILLGMSVNPDTNSLLKSRAAINAFLAAMAGNETFTLTIKDKTLRGTPTP